MPSNSASRSSARSGGQREGDTSAVSDGRKPVTTRGNRRSKPDPSVLKRLVDRLPDIVFKYRLLPKPRYEYISPSVEALTGYKPSDFYADPEFDEKIVHPDDRPALIAAIARQTTGPVRLRWMHKDDGAVWIEVNATAVRNRKGEVVGLEGVARDVSDRVAAEERVKSGESMLRAVMRAARDPVLVIDRRGTVVSANDAFAARYGKRPEDISGSPVTNLWPEDVAKRRMRQMRRAIRLGKPMRFDEETMGRRHFNIAIEPIIDGRGEVAQLAFFARDITRRKRAEQKLQSSEERYRLLYQDNPTMYFTVDTGGVVLSVNRFGAEHLGYQPQELIGGDVLSVFHPDDRKAVKRQLEECIAAGGEVLDWEFRKRKKNGETMWVKEAARTTEGADDATIVLIVCEDITERRRVEQELQQAREELERKVEKTLEEENPYDLTFRQLTVLHLVVQGKSDREIGLALGISPLTVNTHVSRALRKMGASSRTEAGVRALREGLIQ